TGKNNAGKTVFLRAIGIIQVFAQAGLPVPAKAATISIVSGIYSYFSAMDIGQGRFEEEVSYLSDIIEVIKKGDLILLNEVFQSTSYEEASDALCDVLAAISLSGARAIAVTHLPHVKETMKMLEKQYNLIGPSGYAQAETVGDLNTFKIIYE
ncbi:MAG: hypothetical protein K0S55_686, partial [Clostridia bacterium]|nr:hypothetical protein [Clostridia bacterium]